MKSLLMIVPFFPPVSGGGVYRPLGFVKYLGGSGWRTRVITPGKSSYWVVDESLLQEVPSTCEVIRTGSLSAQAILSLIRRGGRGAGGGSQVRSSRIFAALRRLSVFLLVPDAYVGWYPFAVRAARRAIAREKVDAIYSTSPPETSHLIGLRLHKLTGLPWVADFRDPWVTLHRFDLPTRLHSALHRHLEKLVCTTAAVVVASRWHEMSIEKNYPGVKALRRIPNGYDRVKVEGLSSIEPPRGRLRILHAGRLSENRSAAPFLKGLKVFFDRVPESKGRCQVVFLGPREDESEREAKALGLEGAVEFHDSVPHDEALKMERAAHILLLIDIYPEIVLGKLYEYIGVRRPILGVLPEGEGSELIIRLKRGEVAPPGEPERIAEKIGSMYEKFLRGELDGSYELSFFPELEREFLAGEMAEFLDGILERAKE